MGIKKWSVPLRAMVLLAFLCVPAAWAQSGEWALKYKVGGRSMTATLTLEEKDGAWTGVWKNSRGERVVEDVMVDGEDLRFVRVFTLQGRERKFAFSGKMKGGVLTGRMGEGERAVAVLGLLSGYTPAAETRERRKRGSKRLPTIADMPYGEHPKQVIDFWKAASDTPTPLVLYIHGGGFRGGSKSGIHQGTLGELLDAGISVASVEYRVISDKPLPAAHMDARRALQFLRNKAAELNLDKTRVGAFGGSAGAQLCMWLAYHDEMAVADSADPIARESTRLMCVAQNGGQITMDLGWWIEHIPGYDEPHRDQLASFGVKTKEALAPIIEEYSVITHVTADDVPTFMSYGQNPEDPVPEDPSKASGWKVHHVTFGIKLKERMDALGIEADLKYPRGKSKYASNAEFFKAKLLKP